MSGTPRLDALVGAAIPAITRGDQQLAASRCFRIADELGKVREIGRAGPVQGADMAGARAGVQGFADSVRKEPVPGDRDPRAVQNLGAVAVMGRWPGAVRHVSAQR